MTINTLYEAAQDPATAARMAALEKKLDECDAKLAKYRAALEAGTDPAIISEWTSEVTATRTSIKIDLDRINGQPRLTKAQIAAIVDQLAGLAGALQNADPRDRAEVYRQMGLKLTYHNDRRLIVAETQSDESCRYLGVRGGT